jgi:hypothetical protein
MKQSINHAMMQIDTGAINATAFWSSGANDDLSRNGQLDPTRSDLGSTSSWHFSPPPGGDQIIVSVREALDAMPVWTSFLRLESSSRGFDKDIDPGLERLVLDNAGIDCATRTAILSFFTIRGTFMSLPVTNQQRRLVLPFSRFPHTK